jgi:hypothetical protein
VQNMPEAENLAQPSVRGNSDTMIPSRAPFIFLAVFFLLPIHSLRPPTAAAATLPVAFQTVAKGNRSGIDEAAQIVVHNQTDWASLWQRYASADTQHPPAPAIDFGKELVAAVFLGQKPTSGYAIEIVSIERNDGELTVTFRETNPQPGGITTQAFTQPFHIVRVGVEGTPAVRFRRAL